MLKRRAKRLVEQQKEVIFIIDDNLTDSAIRGMGYQIPPLIIHVAIYFLQQNMSLTDVEQFYQHYEKVQWKTITGKPQKNWKVLAKDWIYNALQQRKLMERQEAKRIAFPDT
jgi:hypothetical protein